MRPAHTATKPNEQEEYQIVSPLTILAALIGLVVGGAICFLPVLLPEECFREGNLKRRRRRKAHYQ